MEHSPKATIATLTAASWENDAWAMEAFALAGRRQTPVIAIGTDVVVGFQRPQLDALLAWHRDAG